MPIFPWQRSNVPEHATFTLTEMGRGKATEFTGDPKSRVLMALESQGASNSREIAQAAHLSKGMVERMIPTLVKGGYIQSVRGAD